MVVDDEVAKPHTADHQFPILSLHLIIVDDGNV
jgi:hypothetical protein